VFRKTSGSILCPSCGRLTNADARECLVCGRRNPGMWGFAGPLRALFRRRSVVDVVTVGCVVLFVITLLMDPAAALRSRGFDILPPSTRAVLDAGATGAYPWALGRWWTVLTAIYLHGDLIHLVFNIIAIRVIGPAVEENFGPARAMVVFTIAGAAGFVASNYVGYELTLGASGGFFGLLGAMVAYGRKRGGTFGAMMLRQWGLFAVLLFISGFRMDTVNNVAHAGGFVGGLAAGLVLSLAEHRGESGFDQLLAFACIGLTVLGFALSFWTVLARVTGLGG
jgi:rhomboid protease GluP